MASLFDALVGNLGDESHYYSQDPFYMGGAGFAKMQLPQAQTNSQAIFGPALQGLLAGSLLGYGQRHATQTAYDEAKQNPLLRELYGQYRPPGADFGPLTEDASSQMPENWSIGQGKQDAILQAIMAQGAQEAAQERAKLMAQFTPEVIAGKGLTKQMEAQGEAMGKLAVQGEEPWFDKMPAQLQTKMIATEGTTASLLNLAEKFKNTESMPGLFQIKAWKSGTPENAAKSQLMLLIGAITKLSGEVGNMNEAENLRTLAATLGNISSGGPGAAARIIEAAEMYREITKSQAITAKAAYGRGGGDAMIERLSRPITPTPTLGAAQQNMVTPDGKYRIDPVNKKLIPIG